MVTILNVFVVISILTVVVIIVNINNTLFVLASFLIYYYHHHIYKSHSYHRSRNQSHERDWSYKYQMLLHGLEPRCKNISRAVAEVWHFDFASRGWDAWLKLTIP